MSICPKLNWNRINCGRKYDAARSGLERYALEHWSGKSRGRNVGKGEKEGKIGRKREDGKSGKKEIRWEMWEKRGEEEGKMGRNREGGKGGTRK